MNVDKKLTPIWDELSAIGESAPPGTWDTVPANLSIMIDDAYGGNAVKYDIVVALTDLIMAVSKTPSVMITSDLAIDEIRKLRAENEALKIAHARYECVRCLSPRSFTELWNANLSGGGAFDDLVDKLIKNQPLGGLPK